MSLSKVVYGPEWKDSRFNGWTVRKIIAESDYKTERRITQGCVCSNECWEKIVNKKIELYSLRDSDNYPHVTIEVKTIPEQIRLIDGSHKDVQEIYIYDYNQSFFKNIIKLMLREWISGMENFAILDKDIASTMEKDQLLSFADNLKNADSLRGGYGEVIARGSLFTTINLSMANIMQSYGKLTVDEKEKVNKIVNYFISMVYDWSVDDFTHFRDSFNKVDHIIKDNYKSKLLNTIKGERKNSPREFVSMINGILNDQYFKPWVEKDDEEERLAIFYIAVSYRDYLNSYISFLNFIANAVSVEVYNKYERVSSSDILMMGISSPHCLEVINDVIKQLESEEQELFLQSSPYAYTGLLLKNIFENKNTAKMYKEAMECIHKLYNEYSP